MFGCSFCGTGNMGYCRSLTHGEIVEQVQQINDFAEARFGKKITNIVSMGMGEPLHNYKAVTESVRILTDPLSMSISPLTITISKLGLSHPIQQFTHQHLGEGL